MLAIQIMVSAAALAGPVLAPLAAADFGADPILLGIYVSAVYGVAAVSALVSGGIIARLGPLRVSQICLVLAAIALAMLVTGHLLVLGLSAILLGAAYGPATPASSAILARRTPANWMNLVFSIKQTGVPLGNMLAGAILPGLALAFGWRMAILVGAGACLVLAGAVQPMRADFDAERDPTRRLTWRSAVTGPLRLVLGDPRLRRIALISVAYSGMQVSLSAFLVTYLHQDLGLPLVLAGLVLSTAQVAGAGGRILWGIVADRLVRPDRVLGGLGIGMTTFALLTGLFTPHWPLVAILAVAAAFGGTAVAWNGVFLAEVARLSPSGKAGEVTGGTSLFTFGGVMVTPAAFSVLLSATGSYALGFAAVAVATLASGLSFFIRPAQTDGAPAERT